MKTVGNGFHKTSKLVWRNKGVNRQPCSNPSPYSHIFLRDAGGALGRHMPAAGLGPPRPPQAPDALWSGL